MVEFWAKWIKDYPIVSIEDGLAQDDWASWILMNKKMGDQIQIVGDDLLVTNPERVPAELPTRLATRCWSSSIKSARSPRPLKQLSFVTAPDGERSFPIVPAKPRTRQLPIWLLRLTPARSKPVHPRDPIVWQNTINCSASNLSWAMKQSMPAGMP